LQENLEVFMEENAKTVVFSREVAFPVGPYSQAVVTGSLVFVSGQIGLDTGTEALKQTVQEQTRLALENIEKLVAAAGGSMNDVVKTTVYLADMKDFAGMNQVYSEFFSKPYPARSAFQVAELPLNAMVEIEAVARLKER
jgi:2-iminobutanoate/2-iminopropanoate deaminase